MSLDSVKSLLNEFDPAELIPSVDSLMAHLPGLIRFVVQAGPLVLLCFGVIYLFFSPKEANYSLGFRSFWGMASVDSWQFTQFVAGSVWLVLGLVLWIWARVGYAHMDDLAVPELLLQAIRSIIWEIAWAVISIVVINGVVIGFFDFRGNRRSFAKDLTLVPDFKGMLTRLFIRVKGMIHTK